MGRRKKLHTIHKKESQVKKLPIDNSTGITMQYQEHNPSIPENNIQFGRDATSDPMTSNLHLQTQEMSHVESQTILGIKETIRGGFIRDHMVSNDNHQPSQSHLEQQIEDFSHVESETSLENTRTTFIGGGKKTRGYTHMLDVWDMSDDEFIVVEVDALGNPIGSEGKTLLSAVGSLVRRHQCASINYLSWKDMPESNITDMLELIQSKFQFVPELSEQTKRILKDNMSNKWRQFKHDLKSKAYDASKTEEEMAANIPDKRVDPSQYRALVHHWCSKKGQDISNMNKRSRSKYEDLHCMGTKNIPRLIHEKKKENGVQPSRAKIYIHTRTQKDGSIVNEKAVHVIEELKKHMVEVESLGGSQAAPDYTNWKNDIYSKVKGLEKRGHVRCLGKLPLAKSSNTAAQSSTAELRIQKLEKVLGNLVSFLQVRFSGVQEINDIIEAVDQEIPDAASNRNDYNNSI